MIAILAILAALTMQTNESAPSGSRINAESARLQNSGGSDERSLPPSIIASFVSADRIEATLYLMSFPFNSLAPYGTTIVLNVRGRYQLIHLLSRKHGFTRTLADSCPPPERAVRFSAHSGSEYRGSWTVALGQSCGATDTSEVDHESAYWKLDDGDQEWMDFAIKLFGSLSIPVDSESTRWRNWGRLSPNTPQEPADLRVTPLARASDAPLRPDGSAASR
jgi:hypothetical protein